MSAGRPGLFGKLPAKGDFLTRDLPAPVLQAFEGWLQQVIAGARNDAGPHWQGAWAAAPIWRFWIGPDVFGTACAGAMMTSRDRVGRLFPLIFILPDKGRDFPPPPVVDPGEGWYALLESRLRAAFTLDDLPDPGVLLEGLGPGELPEWVPPVTEPEPVPAMAEEVTSEDAVASAPPSAVIWDSAGPIAEAPEAAAEDEGAGNEGAPAEAEEGAEGEAVQDEDAATGDQDSEADKGTAEDEAAPAGAAEPVDLPEGDDSPFGDSAFVPPDPAVFPDFPPIADPDKAAPEVAASASQPEPDPEPMPMPMPEAPSAAAPDGPTGPAPELWPSLPRREEDPARALWAMAEGDDSVSLLADVAGADHLRAAARRSYWWTNGGGRGPAAMIAIEGMPDSTAFGLLIRGGR